MQAWRQEFWGTNDRDELEKEIKRDDSLNADLEPGEKRGEETWTQMTIPYYAPEPSFGPLPTPEDVEKLRRPGKESAQVVYRVNGIYAVKYEDARLAPRLFKVSFLRSLSRRSH